MNKKSISITLILALLIVLSASTVSAESDNQTLSVADETALSTEYTVNGTTTDDIQSAINKASDGDTVNLGESKSYNINTDTISITKSITLTGKNVNITSGSSNCGIQIRGDGININGITFINANPLPGYGGNIIGDAIQASYVNNIVISNCKFINFKSGVYFTGTTYSVIRDSYFTGTTTHVITSESGTKAVNLMGSSNIQIINNTFDGPVLDGVSIASTSGDVIVENNTFINNTYAVFYGGASTRGSVIKNNRFITCGYLETSYYNNMHQWENNTYDNLPVISLKKSSDNLDIINNTFIVRDNNLLIYSEAENQDHGFPSAIGSINMSKNTVETLNSSVNPTTVTFYWLKVLKSLALNPTGDIIVKNNNIKEGIEVFHLEFAAIETGDNSILIPKAKTDTYLTISYVKDGRVILVLNDINGEPIVGEKITYTVNSGDNVDDETDMYGHVYINGLSGENKIAARYAGSDSYYKSDLSATVQISASQTATSIQASALSVNAVSAKGSVYKFTLKDAAGKALAGKSVSISFNGKIYTATSASNGVVSFTLPAAAAGKYAVTMAFTGDSTYKGSVATSTISIVKQATKLTVAKKTFKKSATKKVTAVLKYNTGKVLKGKKVTMKVNGKTYTAKTNSKGVATFKVKLTKKGTFKATTKFAGDAYYTAKSVTSKIVVK